MKLTLLVLFASALLTWGQGYGFTNFAGFPLFQGAADGNGASAQFNLPTDVATDKNGNVYVADYASSTIRMITPAGDVTTIAGKAGQNGYVNGNGSVARFNNPICVTVDTNRNLYVC